VPRPEPPSPRATSDLLLNRRARSILAALRRARPDALIELDHRSPFELLVATILSAQCTDARVNKVTPALFKAYPDARALADADPADLRGIPVIARGVAGTSPGTNPLLAALRSDERRVAVV